MRRIDDETGNWMTNFLFHKKIKRTNTSTLTISVHKCLLLFLTDIISCTPIRVDDCSMFMYSDCREWWSWQTERIRTWATYMQPLYMYVYEYKFKKKKHFMAMSSLLFILFTHYYYIFEFFVRCVFCLSFFFNSLTICSFCVLYISMLKFAYECICFVLGLLNFKMLDAQQCERYFNELYLRCCFLSPTQVLFV